MKDHIAAGTRALYDLRRYAVEETPGVNGEAPREKVHLRFSVETPTLKVVSHEPAAGQLDLTAQQDCQADTPGAFYPLYERSKDLEPVDPELPVRGAMVAFLIGRLSCRRSERLMLVCFGSRAGPALRIAGKSGNEGQK